MVKRPDDRYPTCGALVAAAREALPKPGAPPTRRRPALIAAGVVAALLIVAAVVAGVLLSRGGGGPSSAPTLAPKVDSLQRIDPRTNKLMATIAAGAGTEGITVGDGAVFVANTGDHTVSRIDPKSDAIVNRVKVAGPPRSIAFGRSLDHAQRQGAALWVVTNKRFGAGPGTCSLNSFDPKTLSPIFSQSYDACGPVATGGGQTWFGGNFDHVVLVDPDTGEAIRMVPTGDVSGAGPHGLAVGAGAVWLASPFTEELLRIDQRGKRPISTGSGSFPSDVAVGEGGVWVTDSVHNTVIEIDPSRNRIVRRVRVGRGPIAVAVGSGAVWVAENDAGTVSRIDPRTGRVTTFPVGPHPRNIAVGEGGVWVTVHPQ
jgi:streptogramin lyase